MDLTPKSIQVDLLGLSRMVRAAAQNHGQDYAAEWLEGTVSWPQMVQALIQYADEAENEGSRICDDIDEEERLQEIIKEIKDGGQS